MCRVFVRRTRFPTIQNASIFSLEGITFTFGWQINEAWSFPRVLAKRLESRNLPVEIINLGVPGFGTLHVYERLLEI